MLFGEHVHNLDSKGRLVLPAKFRKEFELGLYLVKGIEPCISLYTTQAFDEFKDGLYQQDARTPEARRLQRFIFSGTAPVKSDGQNRIMLPPGHKEHAKIDKEVVLVGLGRKVELWAKEQWTPYAVEARDHSEADAMALMNELGF